MMSSVDKHLQKILGGIIDEQNYDSERYVLGRKD